MLTESKRQVVHICMYLNNNSNASQARKNYKTRKKIGMTGHFIKLFHFENESVKHQSQSGLQIGVEEDIGANQPRVANV